MLEAPEQGRIRREGASEAEVRVGGGDLAQESARQGAVEEKGDVRGRENDALVEFGQGGTEVAVGRLGLVEGEADAGATQQPGTAPAGIGEFGFDLFEGGGVVAGVDQGVDVFFLEDSAAGFGKAFTEIFEAVVKKA